MPRIVMILMLICLGLARTARGEEVPRVHAGMLDLRSWDFAEKGGVSLEGSWFFLPNILAEGSEALNRLPEARPIQVPSLVNPHVVYAAEADITHGTYLLRLRFQAPESWLGLRVWLIMGAWRLYAYDPVTKQNWLLGESGRVSPDIEGTQVVIKDKILPFAPSAVGEQELWLMLQISSHTHAPGVIAAPRFGLYETMQDEEAMREMERALLMGGFVTIALYCLALFFFRPLDQANLWASLLAWALFFRYISTEWLVYRIVDPYPGLELANRMAMNYVSHLCTVLLSLFLYSLYPWRSMKWVVWSIAATNLSMLLGFFILGAERMMSLTGVFVYAAVCINIPSLILAVFYLLYRRAQDVIWIFAGYVTLGIAAFNDYFMFYHGIPSIYLLHYAVLALTFWQSLLTGRRFARTYRQNEELLQEISEKERARTLFFHNTSHELRTPLNGMIGFLQLLLSGRFGEQSLQAREQLGKCIRLAESLKNQVNTILDLAKSKRGNLALSNSRFSLEQMSREAHDLAEGLLLKHTQNSFEFIKEWDRDHETFIGDRDKVATIMRNLLGNAFKFVDPKRPNHVRIQIERHPGLLRIEVQDTGIGIPGDQVNRIFDEFAQVAADARRSYEGTGLGLSMVRNLVQLMGGKIEVHSEVGVGSRFSVEIPEQTQVDVLNAPLNELPSRHLDLTARQGKERPRLIPARHDLEMPLILVVDDHEINCEVIQHLLEAHGYRVSLAYGGQEALDKARLERPDLMLLDMMMPQVSGEDVLRAMKVDQRLDDIPVILLTARASDDDRLYGLSLGADDYLAKPLHHEELIFRVRNLLQRIELSKRLTLAEEREKLAQMGELLGELGHELKNIFHVAGFGIQIDANVLTSIIRRLPLAAEPWPQAAAELGAGRTEDVKVEQEQMPLGPGATPLLMSLRMRLGYLPVSLNDKIQIWQAVQRLSSDDQEHCENVLGLVRAYQLLQLQLTKASELILSMLDFSRNHEEKMRCDWKTTFAMTIRLLKPRIHRLHIRLHEQSPEVFIFMSSQHLMQVLINLLANAADAVASRPGSDRWIEVKVSVENQTVVIQLRNGGPLIPETVASRMFDRGFSTKGQLGSGLGLSISRRLIERARGSLNLEPRDEHPCFVIRIPGAASGLQSLSDRDSSSVGSLKN